MILLNDCWGYVYTLKLIYNKSNNCKYKTQMDQKAIKLK